MTKFFLDSCDPAQTKKAVALLTKLDGQTTNPSLLVKNPALQNELIGGKLSERRLLELYKNAVTEISKLIPQGSVSIEVYADHESTAKDLLHQAEDFYSWIPNAHIKFPTTKAGLEAAHSFVGVGGRVNMTLVFSQEQALAVHLATQNMKKAGDVFVSPFVGRLDDVGENGIDLVRNVIQMYKKLDSRVEVLGASLRTLRHFTDCVDLDCDIITAPLLTFENYQSSINYQHSPANDVKAKLQPIPYLELNESNWQSVNIHHNLTDAGLNRFVADWKGVLL
jgi:transaldolase